MPQLQGFLRALDFEIWTRACRVSVSEHCHAKCRGTFLVAGKGEQAPPCPLSWDPPRA